VNGVDLEYIDEGTGVPVVFSHGGSSDLRYWEPQRPVFAARYRFVAYSQRFHGTGRWPAEGDYSAEAHVSDLVAVVRQLGLAPVHLVGFSAAIALRANAVRAQPRSQSDDHRAQRAMAAGGRS
jgi:pimeloyl-ACP methyl ester carboxylesterase